MKLFSKDSFIMFLLVVVTAFATLFYRERQVNILVDRFEKTESLLQGVNWSINARKFLLENGWNIPIPPDPDPKPAIEQEEGK